MTFVLSVIRIMVPRESEYDTSSNSFQGIITDIKNKEGRTILSIKNKETIIGTYNDIMDVHLGDRIEVYGTFQKPTKNTTKYLFNYQEYCYRRNIFYLVDVDSYQILKKNHSIYYSLKQIVFDRVGNNPYLKVFLLGNKTYLSK